MKFALSLISAKGINKYVFLLSVTLLFMDKLCAQALPTSVMQIAAGYSKHGSGDMDGIVFGTGYSKYRSKFFSLEYYFRGSINNNKHGIIVNNPDGSVSDRSIRFTTAGLQLGINGRLSCLRNARHEILVSLGPFARYQSASNGSDGYSLYLPTVTGLPTVLVEYNNQTPQHTYAVGGLLQLQYLFTTKKNTIIGFAPGFQTDTNGDTMPQIVFLIGKRFK